MKKSISIILAVIMMLCMISFASAQNTSETLRFNEDGKFTIMHLTDIQDVYPMYESVKQYIHEAIRDINPDIVVLGGDNCVAAKDVKRDAIKEICDIFVEEQTYFTLVFGNHDYQQGWTNDELLPLYQEFGGEYCLAYDAVPELHGTGTHNLPILASKSDDIAFNLFMFDSGAYTYDNGEADLGYDCVHSDQIQWYKDVSNEIDAQAGHKVNSMAFQHIIVQEAVYDLFIKSAINLGDAGMSFETGSYTYLPKVGPIEEGWLLEHPCPGYHNYGQFDAMVEQGNILAIFSGHDHTNNFTITRDGIDIVNSGGCTFNSYGDTSNRGCRVIVLDENNTDTYETYTYTLCEAALKNDSEITSFGDVTVSGAKLGVAKTMFMKVFTKMLSILFWFTKF